MFRKIIIATMIASSLTTTAPATTIDIQDAEIQSTRYEQAEQADQTEEDTEILDLSDLEIDF